MKTWNQVVLTLCPSGLGSLTLPATALPRGWVLPGAGPINLSIAGASTAARYHSSARSSGPSWPSRPLGARGPL
jgi:hypothetical protein